MDVGGSFGQYTVLAALVSKPSRPGAPSPEHDALIAQWAAEAGFARLVVIKTLFPDSERSRYEQHLESTKKAASLHHPNVRQIHELGSADGRCYLAVEYLEGVTFDTLLRRRARAQALSDPRLFCALLAQACEGIHHAHTRPRLLHGALRPDKLFVTSGGTVKILGLGLGPLMAATAAPTSLAEASRYSYMAPEQILGRSVDARSDVFTLGILAWEALTGRRLFSRPSRVEVYRAITEKPIPSPRALAPSIPNALDRAVARALSADPNKRYKTAREFGLALEEGVTELGAPLSTVAIASIIDRCFQQELEQQRSVVQRARQRIARADNDEDDIFEVPTRLYEGGFDPQHTSEMPPAELERLAAGTSPLEGREPASRSGLAAVGSELPVNEPPDPMADILDRPTPAKAFTIPAEARRPKAASTAPLKPVRASPPAKSAPAQAAPARPAPSKPVVAKPEPSGLDDLFSMPAPGASGDLGPPPSSPRSFERPPETLSDVSDLGDVEADDFEPVATEPPPTGLSDADAAAAAAGAEMASPDPRKGGSKIGVLILALVVLAASLGFAYYQLIYKKAEEPPSPVQVE